MMLFGPSKEQRAGKIVRGVKVADRITQNRHKALNQNNEVQKWPPTLGTQDGMLF
jgi:hypothetical protein